MKKLPLILIVTLIFILGPSLKLTSCNNFGCSLGLGNNVAYAANTKFGALLKYAHTFFPNHTNDNDREIYYNALKEINLDIIEFYIFPDEWWLYKDMYVDLANEIRNDGKELYLAYGIGEYQQYKTYNNFQEYTEEAELVISDIVKTLNPEYFSIVVEPDYVENCANIIVSDEEWIQYINSMAIEVKKISPSTQTIATTQAFDKELPLFERLAGLDSLDKIGINPYFNSVVTISPDYPAKEHVIQTILKVNSVKPVWFTEVWLMASLKEIENKIPDAQQRAVAIEGYLGSILEFSINNNIEYVSPFFTEHFFTYSFDHSEIDQALKANQRTKAFTIYQDFVSDIEPPAAPKGLMVL